MAFLGTKNYVDTVMAFRDFHSNRISSSSTISQLFGVMATELMVRPDSRAIFTESKVETLTKDLSRLTVYVKYNKKKPLRR